MSKPHSWFSQSEFDACPGPASIELTCAVANLATLRAAVDNGANCVRLDCRARNNADGFSLDDLTRAGVKKSVRYALQHGARVCLELDGGAPVGPNFKALHATLCRAVDCGVSAMSLSSPELILYMRVHWPDVRIHFIATESGLSRRGLLLAHNRLGFARVVLPRVLSMAQLTHLTGMPGIGLEAFVWGARCAVVTGALSNPSSASSTPHALATEAACCADSECACNDAWRPGACLDVAHPLSLLPALKHAGVRSLIIDAPSCDIAKVAQLTASWRTSIDRCEASLQVGRNTFA